MKKNLSPEIIYRIGFTIRMFHFELAVKDFFNRDQKVYINNLRRLWREGKVPSEYIR